MPEYVYKCKKCGCIREIKHSMTERPEIKCLLCDKKMKRLILPGIGIIFKADGFYCKGDKD